MKKSLVVILVFISTVVCAQEKSFQFSVGMNKAWFNYEEGMLNEVSTKFQPKLSFALQYNFISFNGFTVGAGARYYSLGRYLDMSAYGEEGTAKFVNDLISLPLQLKYKIDVINTSAILNVETSYIVKSETYAPNEPISRTYVKQDVTDEMNRIQFAIGFGLEYTFNISNETFGVRSIFNYGLTSIPKKGEFTSSDNNQHSWVDFATTEIDLSLSYYF